MQFERKKEISLCNEELSSSCQKADIEASSLLDKQSQPALSKIAEQKKEEERLEDSLEDLLDRYASSKEEKATVKVARAYASNWLGEK